MRIIKSQALKATFLNDMSVRVDTVLKGLVMKMTEKESETNFKEYTYTLYHESNEEDIWWKQEIAYTPRVVNEMLLHNSFYKQVEDDLDQMLVKAAKTLLDKIQPNKFQPLSYTTKSGASWTLQDEGWEPYQTLEIGADTTSLPPEGNNV